jgi:hypothetical protein
MDFPVASSTKGNHIFFGIIASLAAGTFVVDFKVRPRAAYLAFPAVASQDLIAEIFV